VNAFHILFSAVLCAVAGIFASLAMEEANQFSRAVFLSIAAFEVAAASAFFPRPTQGEDQ
jgi:hypothetical protein|tara:strand:- start:940 stop:1119 length:180 start_codon:yes stop_codon:yes gene_type:complete